MTTAGPSQLPHSDFEAEWQRCSAWLQDALDSAGNSHNLDDVKNGVLAGSYEFWPAPRAAIVTELLIYPNWSALHCWLVGGELGQVRDMIPSLMLFAKSFGCTKITGTGRLGWVRALQEQGFTRMATTVAMEIKPDGR